MHPQPPRWADTLLRWFCAPRLHEEVQGDLYELYAKWVAERGVKRANRRYVLAVLGFIRPFALKQNPNLKPSPPYMAMLKNYLTIALRNLQRHKVFSFINVFGLATGIACCLLIFLFIQDELSFDRFHEKADRIYRLHLTNLQEPVQLGAEKKGLISALSTRQANKMVYLPAPLAPRLQAELPEVEYAVRFKEESAIVSIGNTAFSEAVHFTDAPFFQVFSFPLVKGQAQSVLADQSQVVISETVARKYFGNQDPVGQLLTLEQRGKTKTFTVSGVAGEVPANSSLRFTILVRIEHLTNFEEYKDEMNNWYSLPTLVLLRENASLANFRQNMDAFVNRHFEPTIQAYQERKNLNASEPVLQLDCMRLTDTHFDTTVFWPNVSNPLYSYILSGLGLMILLIACINYISLALTGAASRVQEVGVRKVIGASRGQLIWQLWFESQVLVGMSMGLAIVLTSLSIPVFNRLTDKQLAFSLLREPVIPLTMLGITLLIGLIAGGYPAIILSGFQPVRVLKSNRTYRVNPWFSNVLVLVQYSVCLVLVISSVIMFRQMRYISQKELGFTQEQVLVVEHFGERGEAAAQRMSRLKQWAAGNPDVISLSGSSLAFSKGMMTMYFPVRGENKPVDFFMVDYDYLSTLGIELVAGRNFSPDITTDAGEAVIVNETLASMLGNDSTAGGVANPLDKMRVVGIVKDHHYASLESKIAPMALSLNSGSGGYILIRIQAGRIPEALSAVEKVWQDIAPGKPFQYSFLDENLAGQYQTYRNWVNITGAATAFAICIACLGLFGLSGLSAVNRTREIGIRKVLGASVNHIFLLLNQSTIRLIALSFIIAVPLAWYLMNQWLADFAYRITISWDLFALAGLLGIAAAGIAVSFHSLKAASANPVESLRSE
jgi:putative ABC transport system permease protein